MDKPTEGRESRSSSKWYMKLKCFYFISKKKDEVPDPSFKIVCPTPKVCTYQYAEMGIEAWGLVTFSEKVAFSWPSVDRFWNFFGGLITLGQLQSVPNFCWFGQQRAEKRNFWRKKTPNPDSQIPRLLLSKAGICEARFAWIRLKFAFFCSL